MSFTEDDLITDCPDCNGNGQTPNPLSENQNTSFGQRPFSSFFPFILCDRCHRTGRILTQEGEAVLNVVKLAKLQNLI